MSHRYHDETITKAKARLKKLVSELPPYCQGFFRSKKDTHEPRTQCGYAEDITLFFRYLNLTYGKRYPKITEIPIETVKSLDVKDIEGYLEYIEDYEKDGRRYTNGESGKQRKLAALRMLFRYLCKDGILDKDPSALVENPKRHRKEIITLSEKEKKKLIEIIRKGWKYDSYQERISVERNRIRDTAIIILLLGTGIRVSELVGLDMADVDLSEKKLHIIRKGGNEDHVYFNEQVKEFLKEYTNGEESGTRNSFLNDSNEPALFLSKQHKRLTVRAVEKMVKRYADKAFGKGNKISPHKMRSTYGTELYELHHDLELVTEALGHSSILTAQRHYVKFPEKRKKQAAIKVL